MRQSEIQKPLPEIVDMTSPFWEGAEKKILRMQKCKNCATYNFFPKPWCISCGQRKLEWVDTSGRGTVYAFSVATSVMMNLPGWQDDLPVTLCLIDLFEGGRMYAVLRGCTPEDVEIGMQVQVDFSNIKDGISIPFFMPASAQPAA